MRQHIVPGSSSGRVIPIPLEIVCILKEDAPDLLRVRVEGAGELEERHLAGEREGCQDIEEGEPPGRKEAPRCRARP
jgi:hypothetical protein